MAWKQSLFVVLCSSLLHLIMAQENYATKVSIGKHCVCEVSNLIVYIKHLDAQMHQTAMDLRSNISIITK